MLVDREERHLIFGQLFVERDRLEATLAFYFGQKLLFGAFRQPQQGDQLVGSFFKIPGLFRDDFQTVDRAILRQQHSVGVIDEPPWWRHRHHPDTVGVGTGLIGVVGLHLQVVEIAQQHQHQHHDADVGYQGAPEEQIALGTVIAHLDALFQHAFTSDLWGAITAGTAWFTLCDKGDWSLCSRHGRGSRPPVPVPADGAG